MDCNLPDFLFTKLYKTLLKNSIVCYYVVVKGERNMSKNKDNNEIKFDKRNYRKHGERNRQLIHNSLKDLGTGRSIVIDKDGEIIAGNGVYAEAQSLKIPTKIVETDGSELIVVKRTDLSTDDDKRKQLAVLDNSTSDSSEFDLALLKEDFSMDDLQDFGVYNIPDEFATDIPTSTLPAGKATVEEIVENLPEELRETKLEPEALEEIISTYKTNRERIIITYPEDKKAEVIRILGVKELSKIVYTIEEITGVEQSD